MKATIEFNLPDDQYEYDTCNQAMKMKSALFEVANLVRCAEKWNQYDKEQLCQLIRGEIADYLYE